MLENTTNIEELNYEQVEELAKKESMLLRKDYSTALFRLLEDFIINKFDVKYRVRFAIKNFPGTNQQLLAQSIIDSNNAEANYTYALKVNGADTKKHGQVIVDSKDVLLNLMYATNVKGADVNAHAKVILESGETFAIYQVAQLPGIEDVRIYGDAILNSDAPKYNYYFARDVKGADIEKHQKVVENLGDIGTMCEFALKVPFANVESLQEKIVNSGHLFYNYLLALESVGLDITPNMEVVKSYIGRDPKAQDYYDKLQSKLAGTLPIDAIHQLL